MEMKSNTLLEAKTEGDINTLIQSVKVGSKLIAECTECTVVKKYNDFVWRLRTEMGETINAFYALDHTWELSS